MGWSACRCHVINMNIDSGRDIMITLLGENVHASLISHERNPTVPDWFPSSLLYRASCWATGKLSVIGSSITLVCCQYNDLWHRTIILYLQLQYVKTVTHHSYSNNTDACKVVASMCYAKSVLVPLASCQIRKIAGCACAGNFGSFFPATDFKVSG